METLEKRVGGKQHVGAKMMKAIVVTAPGKAEAITASVPEPANDEVLIKVEGCGLCASGIPVWEGREWFEYPLKPGAPGHEGYGVVVKTGKKVDNLKPGDRVAALSYKAFAEYDTAKATEVIKIPDTLKDKTFLGEPLGCAVNIFNRSDIRKGQTVAVIGVGFLGALLIQMAREEGARVIAISKRPYSLITAAQVGADEIISFDDKHEVVETVKDLTGGSWCDRVIEATGKQVTLDLAGELAGIRSKLIIAGFHQDGLRQVNMQLWNWRGIDVINAHERDPQNYMAGMREAVKMMKSGVLNAQPLLTHYFAPGEATLAFNMLKERPEGFIKGIIKF